MSDRRRQERSRRTFQVCFACRTRKVRCDVGDPEFPCVRCRRLGLRCSPPRTRTRRASSATDPTATCSPASRQSITPVTTAPRPYLFLENEVHDSNDAFNALVQASASRGTAGHVPQQHVQQSLHSTGDLPSMGSPGLSFSPKPSVPLAQSSYNMWSWCWLVKNNWLRPQQADWLVEKFFENMQPMTPILSDFLSRSANREFLVVNEPLLCYAILTVSSAYHELPQSYPSPGAELIHSKCWQISKDLIQRVLWAAEGGSDSKLRTLGTVLAMLLLTDWPPRVIALPPDDSVDYLGTDASLLTSQRVVAPTLEDQERHIRLTNASRWMADLTQPIIRSNRMLGMLLGTAEALAVELNVNDTTLLSQAPIDRGDRLLRRYWERRARIRVLLYILKAQSGLRFGASLRENNTIVGDIGLVQQLSRRTVSPESEWLSGLAAWGKLSELLNDARHLLFNGSRHSSSATFDEHLVQLKHFTALLDAWSQDTERLQLPSPQCEIIRIEYYFLRARLGSLCVDTISKRLLPKITPLSSVGKYLAAVTANSIHDSYTLESQDYLHQTLEASRLLLSLIVHLATEQRLQYAPLRVFTRVIFAATMILKTLFVLSKKDEIGRAASLTRDARKCITESFTRDKLHPACGIATVLSYHERQLSLLLDAYQNLGFEDSAANEEGFSTQSPGFYQEPKFDDMTGSQFIAGLDEEILMLPDSWFSGSLDLFASGEFIPGTAADSAMWLGEFAPPP